MNTMAMVGLLDSDIEFFTYEVAGNNFTLLHERVEFLQLLMDYNHAVESFKTDIDNGVLTGDEKIWVFEQIRKNERQAIFDFYNGILEKK